MQSVLAVSGQLLFLSAINLLCTYDHTCKDPACISLFHTLIAFKTNLY